MSQVNDVVGPIASDKGLHILKLTERRAETTRTLAEAKVDIQKRLLDQMRAQKKRELTDETRKSIRVEIYEDGAREDRPRPPQMAAAPRLWHLSPVLPRPGAHTQNPRTRAHAHDPTVPCCLFALAFLQGPGACG